MIKISILFFLSIWSLLTGPEHITICSPVNNSLSSDAKSMPYLLELNNKQIALTWTEKNADGLVSFKMATSSDNGKSFNGEKLIFANKGLANNRMMRAKLLQKPDGTLVSVFSSRRESATARRASDILFTVSTNMGETWSEPKVVDSDPTACTRGFFDAVILPNNELAVIYLKDVPNSKKHEERDLRMVITKNGVPLPERIIDPVVCDCCPVNVFLGAKGELNVIYRDNNNDIRDMAIMTSKDNGATFTEPKIVSADNWNISGCPHSGAYSVVSGNDLYSTWYSGADKEPGIRLSDKNGKKLYINADASAKNSQLLSTQKGVFMVWEQNPEQGKPSQIAYINSAKPNNTLWLSTPAAINPFGLGQGNTAVVAYEIKKDNNMNDIKVEVINL